MLKKLQALRTNENVLIAVDVLLCSKGSFMNVFLMAFMISVSVSSSPVNFIVYNIVRYSLMGIFSIVLLPIFRRYPLITWRISMFFSVVEILCVIFLDSSWPLFPYVLALCSACESSLYWRPKTFFDITEIPDERRLKFKSTITIYTQIMKIIMPAVLGFVIGATGYTRAGLIILGISLMQLLLSFCFYPSNTSKEKGKLHKPDEVYDLITRHKSLREVMSLQFIRGIITCSSACLVIAQINMYNSFSSSVDLGIFTSVSAVVAISCALIYRRIRNRTLQQGFLAMFVPAVILLPVLLIIYPHDSVLSIAFYIVMYGIVDSLYDGAATGTRIQGLLSTHLTGEKKDFLTEVECYSEIMLCLGRVIGLSVLLCIVMLGASDQMMWWAMITTLALIPWLTMIIPKEHRYN